LKTLPLEAMFVGAFRLDKSKSGLFKPSSLDLIFHDCEIAAEFKEATGPHISLPPVALMERSGPATAKPKARAAGTATRGSPKGETF
jgi:hypothetical protein